MNKLRKYKTDNLNKYFFSLIKREETSYEKT